MPGNGHSCLLPLPRCQCLGAALGARDRAARARLASPFLGPKVGGVKDAVGDKPTHLSLLALPMPYAHYRTAALECC